MSYKATMVVLATKQQQGISNSFYQQQGINNHCCYYVKVLATVSFGGFWQWCGLTACLVVDDDKVLGYQLYSAIPREQWWPVSLVSRIVVYQ